MRSIDYLLIGHVTADLVASKRILGGTVSYSALVAQLFGRQVGIVTSCSACEPLIEPLVKRIAVVNLVAEQTTTFENVYVDGGRLQTLHERADTLYIEDIPQGWSQAKAVHFAPLVDELDETILRGFPNATVMLTPQGLMRQWDEKGRVSFRYWFDRDIIQKINVVVFSKLDIQEMPSLEEEYAKCVEHLVVTDGANGGTYYHRGTPHRYDAYPANEVDPTGAGDVFATALLASLARVKGDMYRAIDVAARVAAWSVEQLGVATFTPSQIDEAIRLANQK